MKESQLIDQLVGDLKPGRSWSPWMQMVIWLICLSAANLVVLLMEQGFRPGFWGELLSHPRFLIEILSVSSFTIFLVYASFISFVPGRKLSTSLRFLGWGLFIVFLGSLYLSFQSATPESTFVGARTDCRHEVFIYSFLGLVVFSVLTWKNHYPTHRFGYLLMGMASAVIPGALMQVACMYSPMHSLDHHYGPSLLVAVLFGATLPFVKSRP